MACQVQYALRSLTTISTTITRTMVIQQRKNYRLLNDCKLKFLHLTVNPPLPTCFIISCFIPLGSIVSCNFIPQYRQENLDIARTLSKDSRSAPETLPARNVRMLAYSGSNPYMH